MEPSPQELQAIVDVNTLADWAGLSDAAAQGDAPRASLFTHMGDPAFGASHFRMLASVSPTSFANVLAGWQLNGAPPPILATAAAQLMYDTSRRMCQLEPWPSQALQAAAQAAAVAAQPVVPAPVRAGTMVKLSQVLDQTLDSEAPYLPDPEVVRMHARYVTVMGEPPTPEAAVTEDQLAALFHVIQAGRVPYCDFSLFGSHGTRLLRRLKLKGMSLDAAGQFKTVELFGPSDIALWETCWEVFTTACVMLDTVDRATLARYARRINHYSRRYGSQVWHALYQSDVRARSEEWPRMRIAAITEHNRLLALGQPSTFNPANPWGKSLAMVLDSAEWWRREVEEPCLMILAKLTTMSDVVDGDAPIAPPPTKVQATGHPRQQLPPPLQPPPGKGNATLTPRTPRLPTQSRIRVGFSTDAAGLALTNRSGKQICPAYLAGTCTTPNCPSAHQCNRCLQPYHICGTPGACSAPLRGSGCGKGKGSKGKGKSSKGKSK